MLNLSSLLIGQSGPVFPVSILACCVGISVRMSQFACEDFSARCSGDNALTAQDVAPA